MKDEASLDTTDKSMSPNVASPYGTEAKSAGGSSRKSLSRNAAPWYPSGTGTPLFPSTPITSIPPASAPIPVPHDQSEDDDVIVCEYVPISDMVAKDESSLISAMVGPHASGEERTSLWGNEAGVTAISDTGGCEYEEDAVQDDDETVDDDDVDLNMFDFELDESEEEWLDQQIKQVEDDPDFFF